METSVKAISISLSSTISLASTLACCASFNMRLNCTKHLINELYDDFTVIRRVHAKEFHCLLIVQQIFLFSGRST